MRKIMSDKTKQNVSVAVSIFLLALVVLMWMVEDQSYNPNPNPLGDKAAVEGYLAQNWENQITESPVYISTGVFVESLQFKSYDEIHFSGYIWQKYRKGIDDGITQGFILPDAVTIGAPVTGTEAYRHQVGDEEVIGWHVDTLLRQDFSYLKYPLDHKNFVIRLQPQDLTHNIVLVPDLASYDSTGPSQIFGVDPKIILGQWNIDQSFYNYVTANYDTNFGGNSHLGHKQRPELTFNVAMHRKFLNVVTKYVIPLLMVSLLAFGIVLLTTSDTKKIGLFDTKALKIQSNCATLFFLTLLGHIHLRQVLVSTGIVYLEYFYILLYIMIVAVAFHGYYFSAIRATSGETFERDDNPIAKFVYWPAFFGAAVLITFFAFL
jgi:hypothetical protein